MEVGRMRIEVTNEYPGKKWKDKVKNMSDGQVIALYYKFLNEKTNKKIYDVQQVHELIVAKKILDVPEQLSFEDVFGTPTMVTCANNRDISAISMPYEDTTMLGYTVCTKEMLLNGWNQMIGKTYDIEGRPRRVKGVKVEGDNIVIKLD